jgi:hypothetical protein
MDLGGSASALAGRSGPVVSATDGRSVALHRTLQDLFRAGMHHPLEMVAVDPIESQLTHQRPKITAGRGGCRARQP